MPLWSELAWPKIKQCAQEGYVAILPCGTTEQHGYHLPTDVDIYDVFEVARRVAEVVPQVVVAPPVAYGFSPSNASFPGTLTLRFHTWATLITEICGGISRAGFKKVMLLNGHGGQAQLAVATGQSIQQELGISILVVTWFQLTAGDIEELWGVRGLNHAGEWETALQLYLRPHLAHQGEPMANPYVPPFAALGAPGSSMEIAREKLSVSGVMGDPTRATAEQGKVLLERAVSKLAGVVRQYAASSPL